MIEIPTIYAELKKLLVDLHLFLLLTFVVVAVIVGQGYT